MSDSFQYIIAGLIVVLIALVLYLLSKLSNKGEDNKETEKSLLILQEQIKNLSQNSENKIDKTRQELNQLLHQQNEMLNKQLNESQRGLLQQFAISQKTISETGKSTSDIIKQVTEKLTTLEKTNEQVVGFAKQMESLEKILKNPKQRGVLGEYFLETTLKNVLPPETYQMQYKFKNGEIVDAVVFVKDKIIPIDSKFSLENYNRLMSEESEEKKKTLEEEFKSDLKKRIDETSKYIRPEEDTMDFAFMFIPSEGIYYDLLINKVGAVKVNTRDLIQYAFAEKKVIIVSPTSFLAYLQTVMQGLRALKIEESAKQIRENVSKLAKHLKAYEDNFEKVGKHLGTTVGAYNSAHSNLKQIDKDVLNISGESIEITSEEVEKPMLLE